MNEPASAALQAYPRTQTGWGQAAVADVVHLHRVYAGLRARTGLTVSEVEDRLETAG